MPGLTYMAWWQGCQNFPKPPPELYVAKGQFEPKGNGSSNLSKVRFDCGQYGICTPITKDPEKAPQKPNFLIGKNEQLVEPVHICELTEGWCRERDNG